jgi:hypothetical protein
MNTDTSDGRFRNDILGTNGKAANSAFTKWLDQASPEQRHACVPEWNYDYFGEWHMAYICSRPDCDLGTAIRVFWACQPSQLVKMRQPLEPSVNSIDQLAQLIVEHTRQGLYPTAMLDSDSRPAVDDKIELVRATTRYGAPLPSTLMSPIVGKRIEAFEGGIPPEIAEKYDLETY